MKILNKTIPIFNFYFEQMMSVISDALTTVYFLEILMVMTMILELIFL